MTKKGALWSLITQTKKAWKQICKYNNSHFIHIWVCGCMVDILFDEWGKKCCTPGLRVILFYIGFFNQKVPLARFEFCSNKKMFLRWLRACRSQWEQLKNIFSGFTPQWVKRRERRSQWLQWSVPVAWTNGIIKVVNLTDFQIDDQLNII